MKNEIKIADNQQLDQPVSLQCTYSLPRKVRLKLHLLDNYLFYFIRKILEIIQ